MFNQISIEGRLVRDPELKRTTTGLAICNINVACDRSVKKEGKQSLFIGATFFGSTAENVAKYFRKGRAIIVSGRLENDVVEPKNGGFEKKTIYYIAANSFDFPLTEGKKGEQERDSGEPAPIQDEAFEPKGKNLESIEIADDSIPW